MVHGLEKSLGSARHDAMIKLLVSNRVAAGLSQAELAQRLGEYQSFVARLESGQRRVDVVEFIAIAEVLCFDVVEAINEIKGCKI